METLNSIFFGVWYFLGDFCFFLIAFLFLIGVIFSIIRQIWKSA